MNNNVSCEGAIIDILLIDGVLTILKCEARIAACWGSRHGKSKSEGDKGRELHDDCKGKNVEMLRKVSER